MDDTYNDDYRRSGLRAMESAGILSQISEEEQEWLLRLEGELIRRGLHVRWNCYGIDARLPLCMGDPVDVDHRRVMRVIPPGLVWRCKKYELPEDISAAAQRVENWLYANA